MGDTSYLLRRVWLTDEEEQRLRARLASPTLWDGFCTLLETRGLRMPPDDLNEDIHGSREYRANLVNVLTKRAVARIAGR